MRVSSIRTFLLLLLLATSVTAAHAQPARPDFSGKWALDTGRSKLSEHFRGVTKGVVRINHQEPAFSFRRAFTEGGKITTTAYALQTSGTEVQLRDNGMPARQSLRWNGASLVFVTIYSAPAGQARNTVTYSLADGNRTLTAHEVFRGPRVSYENLWVFAKAD